VGSSYRLRIGKIRVIYEIDFKKNILYIYDIDFRGNIY
jgi:mRNA-degrading endonuclease RelE of RelBE toxin-antitoxin system